MRIGIVKPHYGFVGGFELVVETVKRGLEHAGHNVEEVRVDVRKASSTPFGVQVSPVVWRRADMFFRYAALVETFRSADVRGFDLIISSQPPSFGAKHPRHLSLFFHHLRFCYDLSDVYVRAGFVDPELHARTVDWVRRMDEVDLQEVNYFLAGSETVRQRLEQFNNLTSNVGIFHAGPAVVPKRRATGSAAGTRVLCVSRVEFPKRTELFVHAMKYAPKLRAALVGTGSREPWLRHLDSRLSQPGVDLDAQTDEDLWLNTGSHREVISVPPGESNVRITGRVSSRALRTYYESAACVVAPALNEDYGLTALEAMLHAKPLVVCSDGGALVDFVRDGVTGYVVEPTGRAIAGAIKRIAADPECAREMGLAAREAAQPFTWARAQQELMAGIDRVLFEVA
ncbi:MAG TPA: glycosyltransferase family 4 protein [Acidimicrobiales bacterium]|nr:glycosyltransferase family 4 protein [Acidimicrobiales bacterium]